ncbi:MAG TPA: hypothetical protein VIO61_00620 [Anaerolineaceae bacterium]
MPVEAVYLINDNHIDFSSFGVLHQFRQGGAVTILFRRNARIGIKFDQFPIIVLCIIPYIFLLCVQTMTIDLFFHRDPTITDCS